MSGIRTAAMATKEGIMTIRSQCRKCWRWLVGVVRQCPECGSDEMISQVSGVIEAKAWEERPRPECQCGHCKIIITDGPPWMWMETVMCGGTAAAIAAREAL